jgi:hypothetical protein
MGFSGNGEAAVRLLGQLGEGLGMVLEALRNYSLAYEALGGQRGEFNSSIWWKEMLMKSRSDTVSC